MDELDKARKKTDKKLKELEKKILEIYKQSESEIRKKWDEYLDAQNAYIKDLQEAKERAEKAGFYAEVKKIKEQIKKECIKRTINNRHFRDMVYQVTEQIAHVNEIALNYINGEITDFYVINSNGAAKNVKEILSERGIPVTIGGKAAASGKISVSTGIRFDLMDAATAKRLLTDDTLFEPLFKKLNKTKDKRWNRKLIHSQVTQGILQGESIPKIAARIQNVTGANAKSAVRNARTMCTAAEARGRLDRYYELQNRGFVIRKVWIATEDSRTRKWHSDLDGKELNLKIPFQNKFGSILYPGDPDANGANIYNCRCTLKSHIIGFRRKDGSISKIENYMEDGD